MGRRTIVVGGIAIGAITAVILVMAWIKGGEEPMRWIEQPISAPTAAQGATSGGAGQRGAPR